MIIANPKKARAVAIALLLTIAALSFAYVIYRTLIPTPGTVIILNGTSSSGKTSMVIEFQKRRPDYAAVYIDDFISDYMTKNPVKDMTEFPNADARTAYAQTYNTTMFDAFFTDFYPSVRKKALHGTNIIVDTVITGKDAHERLHAALHGVPHFTALLYCPLDVTLQRVQERNATGIPAEQRDPFQPIGQFMELYQRQEDPEKSWVGVLESTKIKDLIRTMMATTLQKLPDELKDQSTSISAELERAYQQFVDHFELDTNEFVHIEPQDRYTQTFDCHIPPERLAEQLDNFLFILWPHLGPKWHLFPWPHFSKKWYLLPGVF